MYHIVKNVRDNDKIRESFNRLAQETFGLDFEDWYRNGYWGGNYIPYSIAEEGKVVANVSVNIMDMRMMGRKVHLIQLGTVMTAKEYRNRGLIRSIMEEIEMDYGKKAEGIYLFANDSVLELYPRFGFHKEREYQYVKRVRNANASIMRRIPMRGKEEWELLENAIEKNRFCGQLDMADNRGLFMFYVTKFMPESVYYSKELDAYAIAEVEDGNGLIHAVFSEHEIGLEEVVRAFGDSMQYVTLGFTPADGAGYDCVEWKEEDTTLFVKGRVLEGFGEKGMMFPTLSHA